MIEARHIEYFTKSLNNDSSNILIVSPNYHRIIHKNNPVYNRQTKCFEFANGEQLALELNFHLRELRCRITIKNKQVHYGKNLYT